MLLAPNNIIREDGLVLIRNVCDPIANGAFTLFDNVIYVYVVADGELLCHLESGRLRPSDVLNV